MDSGSSNEDDEPKICTVFSSSNSGLSTSSKTIFDTIAFTSPKAKDPGSQAETSFPSLLTPLPTDSLVLTPTTAMSKTNSMVSMFADDLQSGDHNLPPAATLDGGKVDLEQEDLLSLAHPTEAGEGIKVEVEKVREAWEDQNEGSVADVNLQSSSPLFDESAVVEKLHKLELERSVSVGREVEESESPLPTATSLFADRPEVPFPVNIGVPDFPSLNPEPTVQPSFLVQPPPVDTFSSLIYTSADMSFDAWIPSVETRSALASISTVGPLGIVVPDKAHMTMPGIKLEEDLVDKVGANMSKIFGEAEASRRKILTADSVTQDDNGLRELIKLGCYRSAVNLTKRLLTLYGQGPGKVGHYSKHTPHSLQLWFTRISLLVRIREFAIAESELEAFRNFDSPDLYYEYYPVNCFGSRRKGSLVPFHFRLLAAEVPQYMRKFNDTIDRLCLIQFNIQLILTNLENGLAEDGSPISVIDPERRETALSIWRKREVRVLYSFANAALFSKDFYNAFNFLTCLCAKDPEHQPQLKSAVGRLFLQHGDVASAQDYFTVAADLRSPESETDQVDTLVDSALVSISQNLYPEAIVLLRQALILQPDNFMITNNMSVCLLYMGKVKESLGLMEAMARQNIPQSLQENVILNLSSIYELENSDGAKKHALLKLISEYKGDGINLASLKMPNLV